MQDYSLPDFAHPFFWDVNKFKIDTVKDYYFVIERLLEYADDDAIRWLKTYYSDKQLQEVIRSSRRISKKTALLWQNYFEIPVEEIRCLNGSFQKTDRIFWDY